MQVSTRISWPAAGLNLLRPRLPNSRFGLIVAYTLATVLAQCAHDHFRLQNAKCHFGHAGDCTAQPIWMAIQSRMSGTLLKTVLPATSEPTTLQL
jgi:hypothetical protein